MRNLIVGVYLTVSVIRSLRQQRAELPKRVEQQRDPDPFGEDYGCNSIFGMG